MKCKDGYSHESRPQVEEIPQRKRMKMMEMGSVV